MDPEIAYREFGIDLSLRGGVWKGLCPFHEEKTPSFTVYPDLTYYCFGCKKYGTYESLVKSFLGESVKTTAAIDPDTANPRRQFNVKRQRMDKFNDLKLELLDADISMKVAAFSSLERIFMNCRLLEMSDADDMDIILWLREKYTKLKSNIRREHGSR